MIIEYCSPSSIPASLKGEKNFGTHKVPLLKAQKDLQGGVTYTEGKSVSPPYFNFKTGSYVVDGPLNKIRANILCSTTLYFSLRIQA